MIDRIKNIWEKTDDVVLRYPMVLLMAALAAAGAFAAVSLEQFPKEDTFPLLKFTITALLGISVMFGIKMLSQRIGKAFVLELLGTLFLFCFYLVLPKTEKEFTDAYVFVIFPSFILSHLFVSFAPFLNKISELNFWQYNKNLFISLFLTVIFTGVLTGGVMLAILAVDKLFVFNFDELTYPKTFFILAIFGSCFIFLLFNEKGLNFLEKNGNYPQILKFFTQFILIPLLIIYAVILYFYSASILINWKLPTGWVSYLVLAYSVVGILALLLVHPLNNENAKSWVKLFSKIFYFILIPLLVLLFVAINTRILEYGYTEARYFVLLLALWLTSVVFYFVFFKNANIKFIPTSLFTFGLFAMIFPYFNTFSVAKRSQKNELEKLLKENDLLHQGTIDFSKKVSDSVADEVANKMGFLAERKEKDYLLKMLSGKNKKELQESFSLNGYSNIEYSVRNFFINTKNVGNFSKHLELIAKSKLHDTSGYQYVTFLNAVRNGISIDGERLYLENAMYGDKKIFTLSVNGDEKVNLYPKLKNILSKYKDRDGQIPVEEIVLEADLKNFHVKIFLDNLVVEKFAQESIYFNDGIIFIRKNN